MGYIEYKKNLPKSDRILDYMFYKIFANYTKKMDGVFDFEGTQLKYFNHHYNKTWLNERQIEIPIFEKLIAKYIVNTNNILEIGNTYNHYYYFRHDVIDKYEKAHGVFNDDFPNEIDFTKKYDCIFSISTFEHIGYNEKDFYADGFIYDFNKALKAIRTAYSMLNKHGLLAISFTIGFNDFLDENIIKNPVFGFDKAYYYKRYAPDIWLNVDKALLQFRNESDRHTNITRECFIGYVYKR